MLCLLFSQFRDHYYAQEAMMQEHERQREELQFVIREHQRLVEEMKQHIRKVDPEIALKVNTILPFASINLERTEFLDYLEAEI